MCQICENIDYPTSGWPWVPCAPRPPGPRDDRLDRLLEKAESLLDRIEGQGGWYLKPPQELKARSHRPPQDEALGEHLER